MPKEIMEFYKQLLRKNVLWQEAKWDSNTKSVTTELYEHKKELHFFKGIEK